MVGFELICFDWLKHGDVRRASRKPEPIPPQEPGQPPVQPPGPAAMRTLRIMGTVPPEVWNRIGMKIIPKLRAGSELKIEVDFSVSVAEGSANSPLWLA